jgi:endonuclease IV
MDAACDNLAGATDIIFHRARILGSSAGSAAGCIERLHSVRAAAGQPGNLRPETMGKSPCWLAGGHCYDEPGDRGVAMLDFAHLHAAAGWALARTMRGEYRDYQESRPSGAQNLHIHCQDDQYGPKGEKNHLKRNPIRPAGAAHSAERPGLFGRFCAKSRLWKTTP